MSLTLDSTIKLASGNLIPRLGYGVYQARGSECEDGVREAIKVGYRHVDSAQAYRNEDCAFESFDDPLFAFPLVFLSCFTDPFPGVSPPPACFYL